MSKYLRELGKAVEKMMPEQELKATKYHGEMAEAVLIGKKQLPGIELHFWDQYLNADFQTDGSFESDVMVIEMTQIKGEFQHLCKECGIIDKRNPCEHTLSDPSIVGFHKYELSTKRLDLAMNMIKVPVYL